MFLFSFLLLFSKCFISKLSLSLSYSIPVKQDEIRLAHIKKYFPLSGEYIFRFKYKYNNQIVWMDVPENSKKLPIFEGRIFLKATRISWNCN